MGQESNAIVDLFLADCDTVGTNFMHKNYCFIQLKHRNLASESNQLVSPIELHHETPISSFHSE